MRVAVCIATYNQGHLLREAIASCMAQDYENLDVCVFDDYSTDATKYLLDSLSHRFMNLHYTDGANGFGEKDKAQHGTGGAFNKAIEMAGWNYISADIVVLLCSDDVFTNPKVISDIVNKFKKNPCLVHVSRYYHQFIDGDRSPVRAWRTNDIIELANNPSGLAFRRDALLSENISSGDKTLKYQLSNKMFVEAASLVSSVLKGRLDYPNVAYAILPYDTVAVRIHQSISRSKDYYLKRWTSSPVEEWAKVGGRALANDFTSLIQIKNYFTIDAVIKECVNFVKVKPKNIINPSFWLFSLVAILTPRWLLLKIPHWYRVTWGKATTKEVKRT